MGDLNWWEWFYQIITAAGGFAGVAAIFLHFSHSPDTVERWVDDDTEYRKQLAGQLRSGSRLGGLYQHALATALTWLDRRFGAANSSRALGVCIIIALYYAYAAFFLAWGVGGPGDIGGVAMLDDGVEWPQRLPLAFVYCILPPIAFLIGRWLARQERRLKLRLRRRKRWRRRAFERVYRGSWIAVILAVGGFATATDSKAVVVALFMAGVVALGPVAGTLVARRSTSDLRRSLKAAGAGAVAGAVAGAGAFAGAVAVVVGFAVAGAGAGAVAVAGAVAGAVAFAGAAAFAVAVAGAFAVAVAGAGAGAIGAVIGSGRRQGAFAGGVGGLAALGLAFLFLVPEGGSDEFVVTLLVLFLILPLVNGLWDWLSWWVSRRLGAHLIAKLQPSSSTGQRALTIGWHALVDIVASVLLLAAMAYLLALGFAGYNQVAIGLSDTGVGAFNLDAFVARAAAAPWTDGLWLTVMLLSTLVPTALHFVLLLASPIALVALPTEKRLALAGDLETYADQPERRPSIRRQAGQYVTRERHRAPSIATFIFVILMALVSVVFKLIHEGGLAGYVLQVARAGIETARWFAGFF